MNKNSLKILVAPSSFPCPANTGGGIFVKNLLDEFREQNANIKVLAPQPIHYFIKNKSAEKSFDFNYPVFNPYYLSFSNKRLFSFSTYRLTCNSFKKSAVSFSRKIDFVPDIIYGHFLFPGGETAIELAERFDVPAVVALGEGNLSYYEKHLGAGRVINIVKKFRGILTVSRENQNFCVSQLGVSPDKVLFKPNAADTNKFYPRQKSAMRKKFNLPENENIIIFSGHFNHNKGAARIVEALNMLENVYGIFLGSGEELPTSEKILYKGRVSHDEIPEWLSAADIFVLPTIKEASSNAVAEAAACGLPVITSDIPSMHDMLDDKCAVFVEPENVSNIADTIKSLFDDKEHLNEMAQAAENYAKNYSIQKRASSILEWLTTLVEK